MCVFSVERKAGKYNRKRTGLEVGHIESVNLFIFSCNKYFDSTCFVLRHWTVCWTVKDKCLSFGVFVCLFFLSEPLFRPLENDKEETSLRQPVWRQ